MRAALSARTEMDEPTGRMNAYGTSLLVQICALTAATLGLLALLGWKFDIRWLSSVRVHWIPMAPSTALLFALLGSALFFSARLQDSPAAGKAATGVALGAGCVALLLFALTWAGIRLEAEHLGLAEGGSVSGAIAGHMSPLTAACVVFSAASMLASRFGRAKAGFWLACLVIAICSIFLLGYVFGRPLLYGGSLIPPALTTNLAFLALGSGLAALAAPGAWQLDDEIDVASRHHARALLAVFIAFASGLLVVGYFYVKDHEAQFRDRAERELSAVADLKAGELARWLGERRADATVHLHNQVFSELVRRAMANPSDPRAQAQLRDWLARVRDAYHYEQVQVTDTRGVARIAIPHGAPGVPVAKAAATIGAGEIGLMDLHREVPDGPVRLSLLVPIFDADDRDQPLGLLVLGINPRRYLYPLIQGWPTRVAPLKRCSCAATATTHCSSTSSASRRTPRFLCAWR